MPTAERKSVTDSPWFWVQMFCVAGLIGLTLIGPKFSRRQVIEERKFQARRRAAQHLTGKRPDAPLSAPGQTIVTNWPLFLLLSVGLLVSWWRLLKVRGRSDAPARSAEAPPTTATSVSPRGQPENLP